MDNINIEEIYSDSSDFEDSVSFTNDRIPINKFENEIKTGINFKCMQEFANYIYIKKFLFEYTKHAIST